MLLLTSAGMKVIPSCKNNISAMQIPEMDSLPLKYVEKRYYISFWDEKYWNYA